MERGRRFKKNLETEFWKHNIIPAYIKDGTKPDVK
jgi:hypothetical protein